MSDKKSSLNLRDNSNYLTISLYAIGVILIGLFAYRLVIHWSSSKKFFVAAIKVISPYFIGFLLAYLINPLVNVFHDRLFEKIFKNKRPKLNWVLSVTISYVLVLGLISLCIVSIIPQLINSITDLVSKVPDLYNNIIDWINRFLADNPNIDQGTIDDLTTNILPKMEENVTSYLEKLVPALYGISVYILKFIVNLFIALIVSIYIILDKKRIKSYLKKLSVAILRPEKSKSFLRTVNDCNMICKSFFIGKTLDSIIIGLLCFIAMTIMQLPYALLLSTIVGITNMIPYFGPYIGAIPCVIILFIEKPSYGIAFTIMILIIQMFDGMILGPKILGDSTGLRPLVILFAISCGGAVAGPLGMFLGVPFFGIVSYLIDKFVDYRLGEKKVEVVMEKAEVAMENTEATTKVTNDTIKSTTADLK